jgi:DNA-binding transcriptional LysR family regulator
MDSRKLRYFVEVIDQGSLGGASARLRISQAALSKVVRGLETELQVRLLERSAKGMSPTSYGKSLYAHAKTVGTALEHARAEIEHLRDRAHSHISIGALPDLGSDIIPRATVQFCLDRPSVNVRIIEGVTGDLIAGMRQGEYDFIVGLLTSLDNEAGLRRQVLFNDSLSVIAAADHPLASRKHIAAAELTEFPWVFATFGGSHRMRIRELFSAAGCEPPLPQIECSSIQFAKSVIRAGRHLGALPLHALTVEIGAGVIKPLPVRSPALSRKVAAMSLEDRPLSSVSRALIGEIRRQGREAASRVARG